MPQSYVKLQAGSYTIVKQIPVEIDPESMPRPSEEIDPLVDSLTEANEPVRQRAAFELCRIGKPALPALRKLLADPNLKRDLLPLIALAVGAIENPARTVSVPYEVPVAFSGRGKTVRITVKDIAGGIQNKTFAEWPGQKGKIPFEVRLPATATIYVRESVQSELVLWSESEDDIFKVKVPLEGRQ